MLTSLGLSADGVLTEICKVKKHNTPVKSCRRLGYARRIM